MAEDFGYEWGPWIEHCGGQTPPQFNWEDDTTEALVQVERRGPNPEYWLVDEAHHIDWVHDGGREDLKQTLDTTCVSC